MPGQVAAEVIAAVIEGLAEAFIWCCADSPTVGKAVLVGMAAGAGCAGIAALTCLGLELPGVAVISFGAGLAGGFTSAVSTFVVGVCAERQKTIGVAMAATHLLLVAPAAFMAGRFVSNEFNALAAKNAAAPAAQVQPAAQPVTTNAIK